MRRDFKEFSDEKLIMLARGGEDGAVDFLMEKYKDLVRKKVRSLFLMGGDKDDLIQEGMIGLYKAVRSYDDGKDTSFYTFADLCISRQIYSAIKASNRKKNIPLNYYVSIYAPADGEGREEDRELLLDVKLNRTVANPEEILIDRESANDIEMKLTQKLSMLEKQVLQLYLSGMEYTEIASVLDRTPKSIDNALQRIRTKLQQAIK